MNRDQGQREPTMVERLVAFAILMENGDGIVDKNPEYIMEKYTAAMTVPFPDQLLDWNNQPKLQRWRARWREV